MHERLRGLAPLAALDEAHRDAAIRQGVLLSLGAGAFVFRQGESDDRAFFLLEGEVETLSSDVRVRRLRDRDRAAREELGAGDPRPVSVRTLREVRIFVVPRAALAATEGAADAGSRPVRPGPGTEDEPFDWMSHLLSSELFKRIPVGNVHRIITLMESIAVGSGDVVIRQGNVGDYFYYIKQGQVEVTRRVRPQSPPMRLAVRGPGECVGEEALASDSERNATVTMLSDGELLRLSKKSFIELIRKPALNSVSYGQAQMLVRGGAHWLDVRFPEDHERSGIEGSINLPLDELRARASHLDREQRYVVYCDTGRESSAAAFLLTELGLDVCYLAGGLLHALASVRSGVPAPPPVPAGPAPNTPAPAEPSTAGDEDRIAAPEAVASARVQRLVNQLAEVKTQLLASMRLKAMAEEAHLGAERALTAKLAELRAALAAQVERAEALTERLEETEAARRSARERAARAVTALGQRAARARRLEGELAQTGAHVRELEAALARARSEHEALEQQVREKDLALEGERARFAADLERVHRLRDEATEQLHRERHSMNIASHEVDQQLELALRLRSEAEAAMQAAVQLVKERGADGASRARGTGFRVISSKLGCDDGD